jgi:hypothetical protein
LPTSHHGLILVRRAGAALGPPPIGGCIAANPEITLGTFSETGHNQVTTTGFLELKQGDNTLLLILYHRSQFNATTFFR